ncbi:hypothetical protein JJC00_35855 [Bradyrhizobium diazoefficiens]|uniref:hypothetical protein n=1 Tax=Bradyrhizobium diazoefficiens TaxID=1355477 RepID=UPI00190AFD31|nr:hypothetical protein [Bradyrhizobium diazoefficiens]QQO33807.1 hypothetical protein JJC00_35855 [Bradyrhizobium diazoefficiens]
MRWALRIFGFVLSILALAIVGLTRAAVQALRDDQRNSRGRHVWLAQGQGFDLPADTFMMQGHLRQVIAIIPSRKLVILRIGMTREDIGFSNAGLLRAIVKAGL